MYSILFRVSPSGKKTQSHRRLATHGDVHGGGTTPCGDICRQGSSAETFGFDGGGVRAARLYVLKIIRAIPVGFRAALDARSLISNRYLGLGDGTSMRVGDDTRDAPVRENEGTMRLIMRAAAGACRAG